MPLDWTGIIVERDFYSEHDLFGEEPHPNSAVSALRIMWGEGSGVR